MSWDGWLFSLFGLWVVLFYVSLAYGRGDHLLVQALVERGDEALVLGLCTFVLLLIFLKDEDSVYLGVALGGQLIFFVVTTRPILRRVAQGAFF